MAPKPHKSSVFHKIVTIVGTIGAVLLGVVGFAALASLRPEPKQLPPPKKHFNVDVFVVRENCLRETISGFGTVLPDHEVTLSAQVAGEVLGHDLEVGHAVAADNPLLKIDPDIYRQRVTQAERQLEEGKSELRRLKQEQANAERLRKSIQSNLEIATEQYSRRKRLEDRDIVTPDEMARSLLELRQYEENLIRQENEIALYPLKIDQIERRQATSQTALELAQLDLNHTQVKPPFSGIVSQVFVETGDYVRMGDPLVRITNTNSVEIPIPVKLSDYAKLLPLLQKGAF
ncbi:MAG: biotin/lipoyl-binding protein, partial [Planctomycetaceae bacterium]|nr:biotin/lipoyl-binding protein [Planctomycetaceae bacterium]